MRFFEEIAAREDRNLYEIVLYPEGLFYKAYERSAFACVSRVSPFKPSKKHIKYCSRDMVSVGFPAAVLPKYFPSAPRPLADGRVVIALTDRIDPAACEVWKASLPLKERQPRGSAHRMLCVPVPPAERTVPPFVRPAERKTPDFRTEGMPMAVMAGGAARTVGEVPNLRAGQEMPNFRPGRETLNSRAGTMAPEPWLERETPGALSERPNPRPGQMVPNPRTEQEKPKLWPAREVPGALSERPAPNLRAEKVVRLIREFRLEAATPVECLLFVADLKKEIDGYL